MPSNDSPEEGFKAFRKLVLGRALSAAENTLNEGHGFTRTEPQRMRALESVWELENRPRIGPRPVGPVAKLQPSPEGLGDGSPRLWSAGGAALPTFGVPRLRRSDDVAESMSQPFRAGLKFGYRPYGPGFDLRFIAGYHTETSVLGYFQPSLRDSIGRECSYADTKARER